jgi:hypothetical protein
MALNVKRLETPDHPDLYLKELSLMVNLQAVDVEEDERETKRRSSPKLIPRRSNPKKSELMRSLWCLG